MLKNIMTMKFRFKGHSHCEFSHDLYIAEIYRLGAIFTPLIVWWWSVFIHFYTASPCMISYIGQAGLFEVF